MSIWTEFCAKIAAFAGGSPTIPVGYMGGDPFTPPAEGPWLYVKMEWGNSHFIGMEKGSNAYDRGRMSVYVYARQGQSLTMIQDIADQIMDMFPRTEAFGIAAVTDSPFIRGPLEDEDVGALHLTVVIPWMVIR